MNEISHLYNVDKNNIILSEEKHLNSLNNILADSTDAIKCLEGKLTIYEQANTILKNEIENLIKGNNLLLEKIE